MKRIALIFLGICAILLVGSMIPANQTTGDPDIARKKIVFAEVARQGCVVRELQVYDCLGSPRNGACSEYDDSVVLVLTTCRYKQVLRIHVPNGLARQQGVGLFVEYLKASEWP